MNRGDSVSYLSSSNCLVLLVMSNLGPGKFPSHLSGHIGIYPPLTVAYLCGSPGERRFPAPFLVTHGFVSVSLSQGVVLCLASGSRKVFLPFLTGLTVFFCVREESREVGGVSCL